MGMGKSIGKTIVLLILIVILVLLGLLWFDYLGVIQAKQFFAPVYKVMGLEPQTSSTATTSEALLSADLEADRLSKRLEQIEIRAEELNKRESDIYVQEQRNLQMAEELEQRRISQEEREKTFNNIQKLYDDRSVNIETNARYLTGMVPANAVAILLEMEDQDIIDILRKVDEIAAAEGSSSMVAYWLSLMPATRVADIQRKMTSKPQSLN